ncbi:MAG: hypothetical protein BWY01_01843 [Synergistetes bacterium ADurb.Bin155]|nr:MAG: hypothetical protein BWY01_01843 [Synergistetes bacterium ADurb.Bin155]
MTFSWLMRLPKSRTARASVRENSPITWKGKKMKVGRKYSFRYSTTPFFVIP